MQEHQQSAARQWALLGRAPAGVSSQISRPPFPDRLDYLWGWFVEIGYGLDQGYGPAIVTWRVLSAWSDQMDVKLLPWEARALVRLGVLRASIQSEQLKERTNKT